MSNRYALNPGRKEKNIKSIISEAEKNSHTRFTGDDISPGSLAPVQLIWQGKNTVRVMRWGFPNHWNEGEIYAARAETIDERSTFHRSVQERRCIIPTTGFYDKKRTGEDKGEYLFHLRNTNELYVAGIYNSFKNEKEQEELFYCMLTTPAPADFEEYNERIPLVLRKDEWNTWLKGDFESLLRRKGLGLRAQMLEK